MSKERIVNIKNMIDSMDFYGHLLHEDAQEFMWLVEQAERAQELEEEIKTHAPHGRNYTNAQYVELLHENKRYREALEFYADEKTYDSRAGLKIFRDSGRIAKKALGKK